MMAYDDGENAENKTANWRTENIFIHPLLGVVVVVVDSIRRFTVNGGYEVEK